MDPGWESDWHSHPGDVFAYVLDGTVELEVTGQEKQTLSPGDVTYEVLDQPKVARNASSSEGARVFLFRIGTEGAPLREPRPAD